MRCNCENSYCDHTRICTREATGRYVSDYVGPVCEFCAIRMRETGGGSYIFEHYVAPGARPILVDVSGVPFVERLRRGRAYA